MSFENPYQAPLAAVADPYYDDALEAADRGTRLAAVILDGLIGGGIVGLLAAIAIPAMLSARRGVGGEAAGVLFLMVLLGAFLGIFIWNLVWIHKYGQTLGKRIMKVRIVRNDATRAGFARIFFLRMVVPGLIGAIPFVGPLFTLVDICFIFRDDRRCIHDLIADTVVVKA